MTSSNDAPGYNTSELSNPGYQIPDWMSDPYFEELRNDPYAGNPYDKSYLGDTVYTESTTNPDPNPHYGYQQQQTKHSSYPNSEDQMSL
jgi:hypothetical protein